MLESQKTCDILRSPNVWSIRVQKNDWLEIVCKDVQGCASNCPSARPCDHVASGVNMLAGRKAWNTKNVAFWCFLMRIEALETMSLQSLRRFNICDSRVHFRASPVWRHTGAWQLCAVRFAGQRLWGLRAELCAMKLSQEICTLAIRLVVSPDPSTSWDSSPNCGWTSTKHIYINRIIHNEH